MQSRYEHKEMEMKMGMNQKRFDLEPKNSGGNEQTKRIKTSPLYQWKD